MTPACLKRLRAAIYVPARTDLQRKGDNFAVSQLSVCIIVLEDIFFHDFIF